MMLWEGKDLACFLTIISPAPTVHHSANSVSSIVEQNPCSGVYILVEETENSCLKQMNDVISSTDEYLKYKAVYGEMCLRNADGGGGVVDKGIRRGVERENRFLWQGRTSQNFGGQQV